MLKKAVSKPSGAARKIDRRIIALGDWRGDVLQKVRLLIHQACPGITEAFKWRGTPCWYHAGGICTGETYAKVVKLTFFRGAALPDPTHLFNASLTGNTRRAIDIFAGDVLQEAPFKRLVRAAVALNLTKGAKPRAHSG